MAYSNAIYFIDPDAGNDAARAALSIVSSTNATPIVVEVTAHGRVTGAIVDIAGHTVNTNAVGVWKITVINANTFSLDTSVGNGTGGATGTVTPRGGASLADAWKTISSGATADRTQPGDFNKVKASPPPTNTLINGIWTDGPYGALTAITSSTNATPIVITQAGHVYATGNAIIITSHTVNTNANGTWDVTVIDSNSYSLDGSVGNGVGGATGSTRLINCGRVKLASALTANILSCSQPEGAWTASTNVTATINTSQYKEGYGSSSIAILAAFTTGLAAYKALPAAINLSGYKQVSFLMYMAVGSTAHAAGDLQLTLCSDAAAATVVNTINIPAFTVGAGWFPITVDTGAALGASIASVGLNVVVDNSTHTFYFDNIIACKDSTLVDSITHSSLISKNTGSETWHGIQSINGTRIMLDAGAQTSPNVTPHRGYVGTTETVTTWKRECFKTAMQNSATESVNFINEAGSVGNLITYQGGYNRTDMSTLAAGSEAFSWFDGQNGNGIGFNTGTATKVSLKNFGASRYYVGLKLGGTASVIDNFHCNNNAFYGFQAAYCHSSVIGTINCWNNVSSGMMIYSNGLVIDSAFCNSNGTRGVHFDDLYTPIRGNLIKNLTAKNNKDYGVEFTKCHDNTIKNLVTGGNGQYGVVSLDAWNYLDNALIPEAGAAEVLVGANYANGRLFSHNHDQTAGNHKIFTDGGLIAANSTTVRTAGGISWQFSPTSTNRHVDYPLNTPLAEFGVFASALVTAKVWVRRDNTGITARLVCKGGQLAGVANDVIATASGAINVWEELTITFTPTVKGAIQLTVEAYGGTTYNAFFDDFSVVQA